MPEARLPGRWPQQVPVLIAGGGPVGLTLAALLGHHGVRTLVVEADAGYCSGSRAICISRRSQEILAWVGADRALVDKGLPWTGGRSYFRDAEVLHFRMPSDPGERFAPMLNLQQYRVEEIADHAGQAAGGRVELAWASKLVGVQASTDGVEALVEGPDGVQHRVRADWLVACDGGRSTVRETLGIAMRGATFAERWLIVDLADRQDAFIHTRTYCDPLRPTIRLPGPHGTLRYEFMLHADEDAEAMLDEARIRTWMRERVAGDAALPIVRKVVYTFHARMAHAWRKGRVFLAGDAAHLSPPFAGQGMNSGVRDACNLAWKLAAVVRGELGPRLLDTYEVERAPHAWALIRMALRIGAFMQPKSRFSARLMQGALRMASLYPPARDYVLQLKFKPKPRFVDGFFVADAAPGAAMRAGQLLGQPRVELPGGERVPLDDVLGHGFVFIGWNVPAALHNAFAGVPVRVILIVRQQQPFPLDAPTDSLVVRDCEGVLEHLLHDMRAQALLLRPDRYVLAFLRSDGFVDELAQARALIAQTRKS